MTCLIKYIRFEEANLSVENENPGCVQVAQKENRKFYMIYCDIQSLQNVTKSTCNISRYSVS